MNLPNTALFVHSLTTDNRHWQNYLLRLLMLVLIGFSIIKYLFKTLLSAQITAPGLEFFHFISILNLIFITILGVTLFSSAITEEKEVDSLNLLLMTGLTPFTMLLSKSTSKLIIALMLIASQLPFSILSITLGGISMHQVLSVYAVLFSYTLLVCNLALFFSVVSSRTYKAASYTFLVLLLMHILAAYFPSLSIYSPFHRTEEILQTGFKGNIWGIQTLTNSAAAAALFLISVLLFNYFTRKNTAYSGVKKIFAGKVGKRFFPIPRPWKNAIAWKEFYFAAGGLSGAIGITLLMTLIIGYYFLHSTPGQGQIGLTVMIIAIIFLILQCIYISSTIFNYEMEQGTYPILMLLPMSIRTIAYSKLLGALLFITPSLTCATVGFLIMTDMLRTISWDMNLISNLAIFLSGTIQFIFYLYLVTFFSLRVKYGGFVIAALADLVIQIGLGIPSLMIAAISAVPFRVMGAFSGDIFEIMTSLISLTMYIFAILFTHRLIGKQLHELAAA